MAGLKKIKIPYKPNEITEEIITRVLPNVFNAFIFNAEQIRADYDTYLLQHDILSKERLHDDSETNNIVLEPHIFNMVSWKSGYVMGNPIKYAQTKSLETDDIQQLNIFLKDSDKRTIDKEVAVWSYATGVGYYFIDQKARIITRIRKLHLFYTQKIVILALKSIQHITEIPPYLICFILPMPIAL